MVTVVFGARGNVGRHVADGLLAAGERVRATSRTPEAAGLSPHVEVVAADLERPETLPAALEGAEKVFLYAKPDGVQGFVEAAGSAGVRHLVLLSSAAIVADDAERNPIAQAHRTVELAIERSGIDWTFIRPGMFATNTLWWWRTSIRTEGVVRTPYPEAQTAPIHEKDLAALAVAALTEPGHQGQSYTVYGPESLTLRRQVQHIGDAIGRDVRLDVVSAEEARAELSRTIPPIGVETFLRLWAARDGKPAETSATVQEVTGRPARTFAEWAQDHAGDFR
ncbi:NAD(P)H-binding protein [Actinoallomurus iriomotensis]|uniref:Nucleotide-diphosphate-sugar epimerase n=1 Tax=Actinoallomurus iriomotensis TaxID=478107 RepID=A0A9W6RPP8_9ACTN|nr:NAD(P)H-binding protein [Actinoallomurus iriomotensis]GLY77892.1 nucleotide-diphosphate-sugar epimerase [Actinoallomurus iriomotensis]